MHGKMWTDGFSALSSRYIYHYGNHDNSLFLQVVQGSPLPPVPHHIPESSLGNKTSSHQLPTTVVARDIYDEKVGFIWNYVVVFLYELL